MLNTPALVLEILRQNDILKLSLFEQEELASTIRHYSQLKFSYTEINNLCQEVISILNKADKNGVLEQNLLQGLKKTGQLLWDQLLTRSVKDRLKTTIIRDLILSLDEELINIPWELLYTGEDFFCLKFNLGRVVRAKTEIPPMQYRSRVTKPRMLILANPTHDLNFAYEEGVYIKNQFDRKRSQISIDFKSTYIDTLYVKKFLRDYDIVHFAGHCEYDIDEPKNTGWVLSDGKFTTQDILTMGESLSLPSLVFSNACYSAKVKSNLMDTNYQEKTYSLASAFLFSGVRHYIGSIRRIEDPISRAFAKEFYTQLINGKSLGECMHLSRLKLIREYGITNISWVSHLLYGDPTFILFRALTRPAIPKLKRDLSRYKKQMVRLSIVAVIISICVYLYMWLPTVNPNTYFLFHKSRRLFSKGKNEEVISLCHRIIKKEPSFLTAYPLLADTYQRQGKRNEALRYYFDYALYSEKRQDKKHLASAYIGIGWVYHLQGEYPKAFDFYNKASAISRESKDKLNEAVALRKLAVWYMDKEDYDKALELLLKSSEINRFRQNLAEHRYNLANDYFDIGLVFTNKDDFITAKEFYNKSLGLFEKLKLKYELSDYYFNLGEIYLLEKQYQKALDCYMYGLKIDQRQGNLPSIASDYDMIGELYFEMDNLDEAERFFNQSISVSKQIDAPLELASGYYNLGLLYKERGRINKAKEFLREAQEIYSRIDTSDYQEIKKEILELSNPP